MLTWNFDVLPVAGISHDIVGGGIEAPKSVSGLTQAIDFSGGGFWKLDLKKVQLYANADCHRLYLRYRALLNGGGGRIIVPLINDLLAPNYVKGIPFSDDSVFSDGSTFAASSMVASLALAADIGAGTLSIRVTDGRLPLEADMFGVYHPIKGWRTHQITDIDSVVSGASGTIITLGIRPVLRSSLIAGASLDFNRPRCVYRLPAGVTMPWDPEKWWRTTPNVTLVEALD